MYMYDNIEDLMCKNDNSHFRTEGKDSLRVYDNGISITDEITPKNGFDFVYPPFHLYLLNELEAEMAVPGFSKDDLKIQTKGDDKLIIKSNFSENNNSSHFKKPFEKTYKFSQELNINVNAVNVKLENGLLHLTFKPIEEKKDVTIK